jgi:transcriptional regulator with XRE-family HTH domain
MYMIGEELRKYRINAIYTQQQLGEALGFRGRIAEITIQKWEYNERRIPLHHMRKLHELIGIPYEKMIP